MWWEELRSLQINLLTGWAKDKNQKKKFETFHIILCAKCVHHIIYILLSYKSFGSIQDWEIKERENHQTSHFQTFHCHWVLPCYGPYKCQLFVQNCIKLLFNSKFLVHIAALAPGIVWTKISIFEAIYVIMYFHLDKIHKEHKDNFTKHVYWQNFDKIEQTQ